MAADKKLFLKVLGTLNEAQARWYVAREAIAQGRGGLKAMHQLTGMAGPLFCAASKRCVPGGCAPQASEFACRVVAEAGLRSTILLWCELWSRLCTKPPPVTR